METHKKVIFLDLDGTIISHKTNSVPESTKEAIKKLQQNGHFVVIATGRVPALFYGIEKELGIDTFVAANGRIVEYKGEIILDNFIDPRIVKELVDSAYELKVDIGFENYNDYVLNSKFTDLPDKFSDVFHLEYPPVHHNYHLENNVHQLVLFYNDKDYTKFEKKFPTLNFSFSNQYGLDINEKGGLKELGVKKLLEHLQIDKKHSIAVGDGFNDISMISYCELGVAMGNAHIDVKKHADIVAESVDEDGIFKLFKKLKLI